MRYRGKTAGVLAGSAVLPLFACVVGRWESRSGGRLVVADALNRPVPMIGATAVLLLAAVCVRRRWDAVGRAAAGIGALVLVGVSGLLLVRSVVGPETCQETRTSSPARADRVLVVAHYGDPGAEAETRHRTVSLVSGSGLSARRWHLLDLAEGAPGHGAFVSADWTDDGHVRITTDTGFRAFAIDPATGEPAPADSAGRLTTFRN
ncbi:hypothetical protein [Kitasatospora sp. NPDC086791]|uniref:hypothetical protein n=1 Tax=Kitasatospora sp. NPDC086791 TaxID=3155178 RepID=UPI003416307C